MHAIDLWFSGRRRLWVIERLNVDGDLIGVAHCCPDEETALACIGEWLRTHGGEVQFVSPPRSKEPLRQARRKVRRAA